MDHDMYECSEAERESEWTHERYVKELQQFIVYPPEKAQEYLECLLFSEIGEVVGVHAKYVRGDFDETEYKKRLIGELGDVLFAISLLHPDYNPDEDHAWLCPGLIYGDFIFDLAAAVEMVDDPRHWRIHSALRSTCKKIGITIEELREANVKKLQSRKERGKIRGDGDER
jgi:hypothetical protein